MKARGPLASPAIPGSTAGRSALGLGVLMALSVDGIAVAVTGSVEVGFVDMSTEPRLEIETGLVCMCSPPVEKA